MSPKQHPAPATDPVDHLLGLQKNGCKQEAEAGWRALLQTTPGHSDALNNLANLCKDSARHDEAERLYRQAIAARSNNFEALNNLGNLLKATARPGEAEACLRAALAIAPGHPDIRNNLGVLLHEQDRFGAAEASFRAVLADYPEHVETLNNLGNLLKDLRRPEEAEAAYCRLLARQPDHPEARWNLGLLRLLRGDHATGWPLYEARQDPRRQNREVIPPNLATPRWQGESLAGRHLLVWHEQGHGDEIQFARYLPHLRREFAAGQVTLVCKPALHTLFTTLAGVDRVLPAGSPLPEHDCWIMPGSLPLHFAKTAQALPDQLPYLAAPPDRRQRWQGVLPTTSRLRVGLAWAGSRLHKNDRNRSLPGLEALAALYTLPGIDFIDLHRETTLADGTSTQRPLALGRQLGDFADSAALLGELDLLITVDSALAHLAGALGRPCWVMLPFLGLDWRWGESGEHSAWYPAVMRLFRQSAPGDWDSLIAQMAKALLDWQAAQHEQQARIQALPDEARHLLSRTVDRLLTVNPPQQAYRT